MPQVVEQLRDVTVERLTRMLADVLTKAEKGVVDQIGGFLSLSQNREQILDTFHQGMINHFEELMDRPVTKPKPEYTFETLSLVQDDDLEIMVAVEGMIHSARNAQLPSFISFNTRLNSLFDNKQIDESTNPLDPAQVAAAFKDAINPLGMDAQNTLSVYRQFNADILRKLDEVLSEGNKLMVEAGVIPNLQMDGGRHQRPAARSPSRPRLDDTAGFGTIEETHYEEEPATNPEVFSMMQNLLHPSADQPAPSPGTGDGQQYAIPASLAGSKGLMQSFQPAEGQQVQMVDQGQLMEILSNIQKVLQERAGSDEDSEPDIAAQLGEMLAGDGEDGVVKAVDTRSSDVINLVTLLYEAIWRDDSVPIPIKELIGRTQVTIIKVALSDTGFFDDEQHPARTVLNDFAEAGMGWSAVDDLEEDPLYCKMQELVQRILTEYDGEQGFFEEIVRDFRAFRAREAAKTRALEQRIMRARERQERLDDIHELVTKKVEERVLGRELHPFVREMLDGPFHKFMVMLVLKEGPGTNAWKQAINTIDVLLWTVQPHDHVQDGERLQTVNPRLFNNLRKAFRIAKMERDEIDETLRELEKVQSLSFEEEPASRDEEVPTEECSAEVPDAGEDAEAEPVAVAEAELSDDDPALQQVDQLSVGVWVEFAGDDEATAIRCKLAAKINAIDKLIFVNRQGVKVVEKTRMGLARELKDSTVKFISDGPLFSRALESVIGNLRESQQQQQSGSAYRPDRADTTA